MKSKIKLLSCVLLSSALAACGGGGDSSTTTTTTNSPAELATTNYSTGCVVDAGGSTKTDIAVQGVLSASGAVTASVDVTHYSDAGCATRSQWMHTKGPATLTGGTKVLTNGAVSKTGQKGQLVINDVGMYGVSLNVSPTGQTANFVVVDEGSKLYFGKGASLGGRVPADGFPYTLSLTPVNKL